MPPRPNWKGYLKLSLVSCPIALYPATSGSERVSFRQVNKQTGNRLRQQLVDDVTARAGRARRQGPRLRGRQEPVPAWSKTRRSRRSRSRATHTIEIDSFVPRAADRRALSRQRPTTSRPNDEVGQEAFAVIREAMRGKGMVALGRVVHVEARARDRARAVRTRASRPPRCATPTRCARPATISTTYRT